MACQNKVCKQGIQSPIPASFYTTVAFYYEILFWYAIPTSFYNCFLHIAFFPGAGDVWFSLNGITYRNNSNVILENIGEGDDALLCITNQTACCVPPYTSGNGSVFGNWFFPNGTRVPSGGAQWDFYRTRSQMVVALHRRRGGVEGIYRCEIPVARNVTQTIYIGVYSISTGEWLIIYCSTDMYVAEEWYDRVYLQGDYIA